MGDLEGRVALVTGGGSGIGAGCARRLAAEGSSVVLADIDGAAAERVAAEIGDDAVAMTVDVRDPEAVDDLVTAVVSRHGRLDIALNIAGIAGPSVLPAEFPVDGWRDVIDVNLSGVFFCMRAELNVMLGAGRGSIINMASIYGLVGYPVGLAYTAAKHGVVGITRSAALAYAGQGIRINAVAPAVIETLCCNRHRPKWSPRSLPCIPSAGSARSPRWPRWWRSSRLTAHRSAPAACTPSTAPTPPVEDRSIPSTSYPLPVRSSLKERSEEPQPATLVAHPDSCGVVAWCQGAPMSGQA